MDLSKISAIESKNTKSGAAIFMVLGAGLSFLSPLHGVACLGMGVFGFFASFNAGKERERMLVLGLEDLNRKFGRRKLKRGT